MFRSTGQWASARVLLLAAVLLPSSWPARPADSPPESPPANAGTETIVIQGKKLTPDQEITKRVEAALDADRYLDASHITVTTKNGVVTLDGVVRNVDDLFAALRIGHRVATANGAKRVDDNLEMPDFDNGP